jgi:hypothetical protein
VIIEPEARMGFWSLAYIALLHRGKDPITASEMADAALDEFDAKAKAINEQGKDQE